MSTDVRTFIEARTRLAPSQETCDVLERAMAETARRLLIRAHKLALHSGNDVVNARDLQAAVRFELPTVIADAVEANMAIAVRRALDDPTHARPSSIDSQATKGVGALSSAKGKYS
jgi:hypothetical protein